MSRSYYTMFKYFILYETINLTFVESIEDTTAQIPNGSIINQLSAIKNLMVNNTDLSLQSDKLDGKMDFVYSNCGNIVQQNCYQNVNVYNGYKILFGPKTSIILAKKSTMHLLNLHNLKFSIIYPLKQFNLLITDHMISNLKKSQFLFLELLENILYERECLLTYELINLFAQTLIHSRKLVRIIESLKYSLMDAFYNLANEISIRSDKYAKVVTSSDSNNIAINVIKWHTYIARMIKWFQATLIIIVEKEFFDVITPLVTEHHKLALESTKTIDNVSLSYLKTKLNNVEESIIIYLTTQIKNRTKTGIPLSKTYFDTAINDANNLSIIDKLASRVILRDLFDYLINSNPFKRYNPSEDLKLQRFKF